LNRAARDQRGSILFSLEGPRLSRMILPMRKSCHPIAGFAWGR
jgi:hypothetical protein